MSLLRVNGSLPRMNLRTPSWCGVEEGMVVLNVDEQTQGTHAEAHAHAASRSAGLSPRCPV